MHVLHLRTLRQISSSFITAPTLVLQQVKELKATAKKWVNEISKKAKENGLAAKSEILEEGTSIVGTIVEFAENEGIDLIVVGTKGRTGFRRLLFGSVAQGVTVYAHCPVLVVR